MPVSESLSEALLHSNKEKTDRFPSPLNQQGRQFDVEIARTRDCESHTVDNGDLNPGDGPPPAQDQEASYGRSERPEQLSDSLVHSSAGVACVGQK